MGNRREPKNPRMEDGAISEHDKKKMRELYFMNIEISKTFNKQFVEAFNTINNISNLTHEKIAERTGLSVDTIDGWTKKQPRIPSKKSLVMYAIRCKIDLLMLITLLRSGGYTFNFANEVEYAWAYLVMHYSGCSLEECNDVLKNVFGIADEKALFI